MGNLLWKKTEGWQKFRKESRKEYLSLLCRLVQLPFFKLNFLSREIIQKLPSTVKSPCTFLCNFLCLCNYVKIKKSKSWICHMIKQHSLIIDSFFVSIWKMLLLQRRSLNWDSFCTFCLKGKSIWAGFKKKFLRIWK